MNLREHIRRILREEDFIPLESLNTVIKDYEDGFDVFIMNKDKKIGEISFAKEDKPYQYTIVDATIDDEYKGNRIYPKTIINLFKERPNLIINSVFRSPDAEKAWIYLLSDLPSNIEHKVKYYEDEETTLYQLKLKNLQESIRRILREELNESLFFRRRINLDEVKKLLPIHAEQVYGETKSYEQFKYELTLRAVEAIMWNNYELGWEDLPEKEEIEFVNEVANMFNKTIKKLYNSQYRYVPLQEELSNPINSIRRRLDVVDWLVEFSVREIERQYNGICKVRTPETFLEIVIEKTGDGMYWDYFANTIDDDSDEWNEMYRFISIYVEQKFGDKLKQYYHTQCV